MARLTRKELKSDKFALEVQHSVEYVSGHRKQLVQWGAIGAGVVIVALAIFFYRSHEHTARQEALYQAMRAENAQVGRAGNEFDLTFPTDAERVKAANKAFTEIVTKYPGSEEASIADYFLGSNAADEGNLAEAEKRLKVATEASGAFSSVAKLSLAQIYATENKRAEAEKLIQSVIDHPTILVSKEQATIELAELIGKSDPARARKMLEPFRTSTRPNLSRAAVSALGELGK